MENLLMSESNQSISMFMPSVSKFTFDSYIWIPWVFSLQPQGCKTKDLGALLGRQVEPSSAPGVQPAKFCMLANSFPTGLGNNWDLPQSFLVKCQKSSDCQSSGNILKFKSPTVTSPTVDQHKFYNWTFHNKNIDFDKMSTFLCNYTYILKFV